MRRLLRVHAPQTVPKDIENMYIHSDSCITQVQSIFVLIFHKFAHKNMLYMKSILISITVQCCILYGSVLRLMCRKFQWAVDCNLDYSLIYNELYEMKKIRIVKQLPNLKRTGKSNIC